MSSSISSVRRPRDAEPADRAGAVLGFAFIVAVFLSAALVSLPEPDASGQHVADFYAHHRAAVLVTQVVLGLAAVALLVLFARRLRARHRPSAAAALGVAGVAVLPAIATLALALAADPAHPGTARWLNIAFGLTDDLLFLTISGFAATVWSGREAYPPWLRGIAVLVSLVCAARGVLGLVGVQGLLDNIAPIAFLVLIGALSVVMLRRPTTAEPA